MTDNVNQCMEQDILADDVKAVLENGTVELSGKYRQIVGENGTVIVKAETGQVVKIIWEENE